MKKLMNACMQWRLIRNGLLGWLLLLCTDTNASPFPSFSSLGIEHGLSNNTVRCIYQDHNGFMWFGTFDGLNRYDGYHFKVYRNKLRDTGSLVNSFILAITEDSLHRLWVGTRQGASMFEPLTGRFTTITIRNNNSHAVERFDAVVKDIRADRDNNIFIGTEGSGLLICGKGTVTAQAVPLVQAGTVVTRYSVKAVRIDSAGNVWALVQKYGLALYNARSRQLVPVNNTVASAVWLETAGNGIWVAGSTGIYQYNRSANTMTLAVDIKDEKNGRSNIVTFVIDNNRQYWIGTESGKVITWKPGDSSRQLPATAGNSNAGGGGFIHAIYIDRQSRKWIGTARKGISIIDPQQGRFRTIAHEPGNSNSLPDNVVSALYEAPDGNLYIGTDGDGLDIWDRRNNRFIALTHHADDNTSISDNAVTDIIADHRQQIWIATFRKGVNRLNPVTRKFERYTLFNPVAGAENRVSYALCEDHNQQVWATALRDNSMYGALYRFNEAANKFDVFDTELSDLFTLYEDREGTLWGGNLHQLVRIDRQQKKHGLFDMGHAVRCMLEDTKGNFWIGTEGGGLLLFDRKQQAVVARYTTEEGLANNVVLSILEDSTGQLWMSTFNGLSAFNTTKRAFRNYYQADGLQSNQFHYKSGLALHTGELAFGGIRGMTLFRPQEITGNHTMPPLLLTDLYINNQPVEQERGYITKASGDKMETITVPYNQAVFGFRFTALEYAVPGKINYAYYMEGWDRGWNYTGNTLTAAYTHLDEGNYTFRVKSTNGEGEWNAQEIAIRIVVLPPWYRSWWAYSLYAAVVLAAVYLFFTYRVRQSRLHYEIKVANLEAKEAQLNAQKEKEVHEKRLAFFTNVSHEFRTPLTLIINPVKELLERDKETPKEELNTVYRNARRLLSLVDQLLLFRKAETDSDTLRLAELDLNALGREVFDCFVHQARIKRIDYRFESSGTPIPICADREKLEIMLFNLLSNAIKFTPPDGAIHFTIQETAGNVTVLVTDNGPGIPPETGDKLFSRFYQAKGDHMPSQSGFGIGLYLVKHFALLHQGDITYESTPGVGTTFRLALQKGQAHFAGKEICRNEQPAPVFLEELTGDTESAEPDSNQKDLAALVTETPTILVVDDDTELRKYVSQVFSKDFNILEGSNGRKGLALAQQYLPDLIISDITMDEMGGLELCRQVKEDPSLSHIPVILLTASAASENKLKGIESGADDYITKPFEKELLKARVVSLLKKRNVLQQYFYNEITLQQNDLKVSVEYREFLQQCISVVEKHLDNEDFSIKTLTKEMGMSRSSLYRRVNSVSGQSIVGFIRFIRLRKAAELMINTENNVTEIASVTGFNDIKYFRHHFNQLFGMNPSEYIRRFRKPFHNNLQVNKNLKK